MGKKIIICNYSPLCNGTGNCEKCPHLPQVKLIDINNLLKEQNQ